MTGFASRLAAAVALSLICSSTAKAAGPTAAPTDKAPCAKWDISGDWAFIQSNESSPTFQIDVTDTGLQGTGFFWYLIDTPHCPFFASCGKDPVNVNASVDGTLDGNELELNAYWNNGTIGVYSGKINPQGRIEGTTFDRQHPQTMASWYSDHTAKCLDGSGGSDGVGTSSSSLKTPPAERPVRVAGRGANVPNMNTKRYTAVPVCDAAKTARAAGSAAATTLDGMCRSSQMAAAAGTVVTGPASTTAVTAVPGRTSGVARAGTVVRATPAATTIRPAASSEAAASASKAVLPYSLLRKDSRFGTVAAPGMALGMNQPANSIQVRVSYPKEFGYRETSGPAGILGPTSCDNFTVGAKAGGSSSAMSVSKDWLMAEAGDTYICSYVVSDVPLDQQVEVNVDVGDRVGAWQGYGQTTPPPGQQRVISNSSQNITLKPVQNRGRLNFEMVYAPLPGR